MTIHPDAWLSEKLGQPAFSVQLGSDGVPAGAQAMLAEHDRNHAGAFYFAKLPSLQVAAARGLAAVGFELIETSLVLERPIADAADLTSDTGAVALFEPRWTKGVLDVAATAFRYSRFHVDPGIESAIANRVKREWIQSYVNGQRGDALFISHDNGEVTGFAAMLVAERPTGPVAVIDLIGVHPGWQQRGIGAQLTTAACRHYAGRCATMEVGTQAANVPSVRLYERMGFRLMRSGLVFHRHA